MSLNAVELRAELERLHQASYGWALHCCRHRHDEAEDLLQDVYIRVLDGRARFDGRSSAKTWLFGVIRRTAQERARRRWVRLSLLERWSRQEPDQVLPPDAEHLLTDAERNDGLRDAVAHLPRRQREVLHLVFYQDLTIDESAQALGISLGSARTHFERGKQRLREIFAGVDVP
jgi:RNA polymerase sigma factor (sigma-70 family)